MTFSVMPLIIGIVLSQRLGRLAKLNQLPKAQLIFKWTLIFSIVLFITEASLYVSYITKWIWDIFLPGILLFSLRQKALKVSRMFVWAFLPYIIESIIEDVTKFAAKNHFEKWDNYFDTATLLSLMWMAAILFSQNRQNKTAEKERIKKQHEDELNRAIAIRKVELEGLVAERTSELIKQKDELEQALTELRTTQTQLIQSEKMASLGELTAGIAHEIQNPLNFVNNFSEVSNELIKEMIEEAEKGNREEMKAIAKDLVQNLEKISQHGKRADAIVKGMLQHSRSSSNVKEPTDINALVDEYLRLSYHGLRAKDKSFNATLKTSFDENTGVINIVPQDIGRVVLNLLTNAFYAVTEKKKQKNSPAREVESVNSSPEQQYEPIVTVTTRRLTRSSGRPGIEIMVSDNGLGIPEKSLGKIFQPFFTTKPSGQGTGLGLSLSYDIITKGHNGELKVKTSAGEGTTFIINLPDTSAGKPG